MTEHEARKAVLSDVSRETTQRLVQYVDLLRKWQSAINLIAPSTISTIWSRHILDSAQVIEASRHTDGVWLDLGSGGGFPGIVCAIIAAEGYPGLKFRLVESDLRKASFLRDVVRKLQLDAVVFSRRVEDLPPQEAAIISARALAPLEKLCAMSYPLLSSGGEALFLKGKTHLAEIEAAKTRWQMQVDVVQSKTSADAALLRVKDLRPHA